MSRAGRPSNRIPGMRLHRMSPNGDSPSNIPDDIIWDDNNPPVLNACTQHTFHHPRCEGDCESQVATEYQIKLINEGLAFARAGMNHRGVPAAYETVIPIPGIKVELTDVLMRLELIENLVLELTGMSRDELDEKFRMHKYQFLHDVRMHNEAGIRRQRTANALGIVDKPILGPDGKPL